MERFVSVARRDEIAPGQARVVEVEGRQIALVSCGDDVFYAVDNICSHAYAELAQGDLDCDELTIECPLHGSQFDLRSGRPRTFPATQPIATYPVRLSDDAIQIGL